MPDRIFVELFTLKSFSPPVDEVGSHLSILESSPDLVPTHWGMNERPSSRRKYSRDEVLCYVEQNSEFDNLHIYRKRVPSYNLHYSSNLGDTKIPSALYWQFEKDVKTFDLSTIHTIFDVSSILASQLDVLFGYIWTPWADNQGWKQYMSTPLINAFKLAKYGPNPVHVRTWFGSYIVEKIGYETLAGCGALAKETSWNGVELDLVSEPWNSSLPEIIEQQKKVMAVLEKTEVFGNYQKDPICETGKKWVPFFGHPLQKS